MIREAPTDRDIAAVEAITRSSGFFSEEETAIAVEVVSAALREGAASGYLCRFAEVDGRVVGFSCHGPIPATRASYDLYWIAVEGATRGLGIGRRLVEAVERDVRQRGGRQIYVETAGRSQYAPTRRFYERCGYEVAATLDDFYAPGDAKVIFVKRVAGG